MDWFRRHFLTIDPRTLALTRVALGLLLLVDLAKRLVGLEAFYTDGGLLPRDVMQRLHPTGLSAFWHVGTAAEVAIVFAACALIYVALLVGFLTPLAKVLSLVAIVSLQARVQLLTIGGDIVVCILCWWTLFLPLGRCFSVDAWLEHRRARNRSSDGVRYERAPPAPVTSIAAFGAPLQLAVIYLFNALHKSGATWTEGTAIHYTLWLDRVVTPFAAWYRGILSPFGSELLTWATLVTEGALPFLIMSPWGRPWTRRLAILLIVGLHLGIALVLNIGIFSAAMIAFATLLVSTRDWEDLARIARRRMGRPPEAAPVALRGDLPSTGRERLLRIGRELLAGAFFAQFVVATLQDNWAVPESLKPGRPAWFGAMIGAARLHQGWHMFSPDVGTAEMAMVVDALTVGGRRVDPVAELSARYHALRVREVPEQVGQDVFWHHYALRLPEAPAFYPALSAWILSYHERTGRPEDRILRFRAFVVARPSPPPGSDTPGPPTERLFLEGSSSFSQ